MGEDGATHQCNEDIALMRVIPGMTILSPADGYEAKACVRAAAEYVGPTYLRFGRMAVPFIFEPDYKIEIGKGVTLKDGNDVTIIATGLMTGMALEAAKSLENEGINARVINIHTIKPLDKMCIRDSYKTVISHGWVVDGEGRKMSKSLGNGINPDDIVKKYGAEILRLWVASSDYHADIRISPEILKQLSEGYRKIRNRCV